MRAKHFVLIGIALAVVVLVVLLVVFRQESLTQGEARDLMTASDYCVISDVTWKRPGEDRPAWSRAADEGEQRILSERKITDRAVLMKLASALVLGEDADQPLAEEAREYVEMRFFREGDLRFTVRLIPGDLSNFVLLHERRSDRKEAFVCDAGLTKVVEEILQKRQETLPRTSY